jgi:hypothetical protein
MGVFKEVVKEFVNGFVAGAMDNMRASSSPNGVAAIEQFCRELCWSVDERVGDRGIVLHFRDPLMNIRKVLVTCGESIASILTFSAATLLPSQVPQEVLGYLLIRNNELTTGAWRVSASDDGNASFALAYCALIGGLNADTFKYICETQVKEAHAFDTNMKSAGLL